MQPLGVGLGLAVRINNQYSDPVFMGYHSNAHATINKIQDNLWSTIYLLRNIYVGLGKHRNVKTM